MKRILPLALLALFPLSPSAFAQDADKLRLIDMAMKAAIEKGDLPGGVVLVLHRDKVIHRKAYGHRATQPILTLTGEDTLYDMASLTKPIVTALSLMLLLEEGKLKLDDPVAKHLPGFRRKETDGITLEHLLLHTSGLPAGNGLADYREGPAKAWDKLYALKPTAEPGARFTYSDLGYILLGKIVESASGQPLDAFAKQRIFDPLGMKETGFRPQGELKKRAATTQQRDGHWMVGEVHDPRAYLLGEVAGHAGLFSTADDLAILAKMLLHQGQHDRKAIFRKETIQLMTAPRKVQGAKQPGLRGLGWDIDTAYSSNRGELFSKGVSYGHTGFTGTSLWIDPPSQTAVIFLSNRVHPDGKGNVTKLRSQVATYSGQAVGMGK
jgi:CubicO group peptidase (beta-lactamase class C family)